MPPLLSIDKLTKVYGKFAALRELSLAVRPGEVVGLLGPNGSGKTTALRTVLGFLKPTSGRVTLAGHDCWRDSVAARRHVAYLPGELRLYDSMTGRQLVRFLARLRGEAGGAADPADIDPLARRLDIDPDKPLTTLSSGMKRKVALLTVLLPRVPLVILDEPTNTLDPTMRDALMEQLLLAKVAGKAVLFSSHVLAEVEAVCDRVVFLRRGELVHVQEMSELRTGRRVAATFPAGPPPTGPAGEPLPADGDRVEFDTRAPTADLLAWLARHPVTDLRVEPLGLDGLYKRFHAEE
jgi:ABC-2 type transport system ATP-binding protein